MNTIQYFNKDITIFYNDYNNNCAVNNSIKNGRIWEQKLINIYKEYINSDSVVIDIGSNLGTHTIPFSLLSKYVYSFEPQKNLFNLLKKTIEYNNLDNVKLFNNIVSNINDDLYFNNTGCGRGGLSKYRPRLDGIITKEKSITIDSLNLEKCNFIKIDTEGSEWDVLAGSHKTIIKFKPIIILETWKSVKNKVKLNDFCSDYGYNSVYLKGDNYLLTPR